ncbi:hypothetical protein SEVIR_5G099351v4 [Setaria viridis]
MRPWGRVSGIWAVSRAQNFSPERTVAPKARDGTWRTRESAGGIESRRVHRPREVSPRNSLGRATTRRPPPTYKWTGGSIAPVAVGSADRSTARSAACCRRARRRRRPLPDERSLRVDGEFAGLGERGSSKSPTAISPPPRRFISRFAQAQSRSLLFS